MTTRANTGERLARIETILERMDKKLDSLESEQRKDVEDLATLKNRGIGLIVGVAIAAGSAGAALANLLKFFH